MNPRVFFFVACVTVSAVCGVLHRKEGRGRRGSSLGSPQTSRKLEKAGEGFLREAKERGGTGFERRFSLKADGYRSVL